MGIGCSLREDTSSTKATAYMNKAQRIPVTADRGRSVEIEIKL
jgi:hypothetical protein